MSICEKLVRSNKTNKQNTINNQSVDKSHRRTVCQLHELELEHEIVISVAKHPINVLIFMSACKSYISNFYLFSSHNRQGAFFPSVVSLKRNVPPSPLLKFGGKLCPFDGFLSLLKVFKVSTTFHRHLVFLRKLQCIIVSPKNLPTLKVPSI